MSHQFIDNSGIDFRTRRLIRSHVAKGKSTGKRGPRTKRQKPGPVVRTLVLGSILERADDELDQRIERTRSQLGLRQNERFRAVCLPAELNDGSKDLISRYFDFFSEPPFPPELCDDTCSSFAGSLWIQLIFTDEIYLYCSVAVSAAATACPQWQEQDSNEAAGHLARIFRLLNDRLSGDDALSDTTVAAVVALTQYERYTGRYILGLVHFDGLLRLVELRGGISQLASKEPSLAQKIFRADLEFALQLGSATRYNAADTPGSGPFVRVRSQYDERSRSHFYGMQIFEDLSSELRVALLDVSSFSMCLNSGFSGGSKLDSLDFHNVLVYLGYLLIQAKPIAQIRFMNENESTMLVGLICFMVHFLIGLNRQIPEFPLLADVARSTVRGRSSKSREEDEILLWVLFVGYSSIFGEVDESWLLPAVDRTIRALGIFSWQGVHGILSQFPWVNGFNDRLGRTLWRSLGLQPDS